MKVILIYLIGRVTSPCLASFHSGTWTLDEEEDKLQVVFTKCSKGVQETEGTNVTVSGTVAN